MCYIQHKNICIHSYEFCVNLDGKNERYRNKFLTVILDNAFCCVLLCDENQNDDDDDKSLILKIMQMTFDEKRKFKYFTALWLW